MDGVCARIRSGRELPIGAYTLSACCSTKTETYTWVYLYVRTGDSGGAEELQGGGGSRGARVGYRVVCAVGEDAADDDEPPSSQWAIFFLPYIVFLPPARPIDTAGAVAIT